MENVFLLYSKKNKQIFKKKAVVIIIQFLSVVWFTAKKKKNQKGTLGLFPQRLSILKLSTLCY